MGIDLAIGAVRPRKLAAVRRQVAVGALASASRPALDQVWNFLRSQPELRSDGHNIFLYQHPTQPGAPILCDFGVEITSPGSRQGRVRNSATFPSAATD